MNTTKAWIQAFRLRTLPLAFSCILMGAFLAAGENSLDGWILSLSLLTTLFLQVLSNLANDYGDATSGVDGHGRTGPKRTVSAGLISRKAMKKGLIVCSVLSLLSGVGLIRLAFGDEWEVALVFLLLGLGAIIAAINYTVGKNPYGYSGFGDLFVMIFFGVVGVGGSYYLHTHYLDLVILLPAYSCGAFAVGVLNVNNIRDIESDKAAGKYSLPVRMGRSRAIMYHWFLLASGMLTMILYVFLEHGSIFEYIFLLTLPLFVSNAWAVKSRKTSEQLDPYLKQLALATLFFVLLFGIGQISV